jgi:hypothetical protein
MERAGRPRHRRARERKPEAIESMLSGLVSITLDWSFIVWLGDIFLISLRFWCLDKQCKAEEAQADQTKDKS